MELVKSTFWWYSNYMTSTCIYVYIYLFIYLFIHLLGMHDMKNLNRYR